MSKSRKAVEWILSASEGVTRTQKTAAEKFGVSQAAISVKMLRSVHPLMRPDARRKKKGESK